MRISLFLMDSLFISKENYVKHILIVFFHGSADSFESIDMFKHVLTFQIRSRSIEVWIIISIFARKKTTFVIMLEYRIVNLLST